MQGIVFGILGIIFFPFLALYGALSAIIFMLNAIADIIEFLTVLAGLFNQFVDYINEKFGKK